MMSGTLVKAADVTAILAPPTQWQFSFY